MRLKNARNGREVVRFDNEKDSYLLKVFNFYLEFFYKFDLDVVVFC